MVFKNSRTAGSYKADSAIQVKWYPRTIVTLAKAQKIMKRAAVEIERWKAGIDENGIKVVWDHLVFHVWIFGEVSVDATTEFQNNVSVQWGRHEKFIPVRVHGIADWSRYLGQEAMALAKHTYSHLFK